MGNAVWLVFALPSWFAGLFVAAFLPDDGFKLQGIIAIAGSVAFVAGVVLTVVQSKGRPYVILASLLLSFIVVAIAGLLRGNVKGDLVGVILWSVTALQLANAIAAISWARGARLATVLMTPLCASFWMFAELVAAMSFQDVWL